MNNDELVCVVCKQGFHYGNPAQRLEIRKVQLFVHDLSCFPRLERLQTRMEEGNLPEEDLIALAVELIMEGILPSG